MGPRVTGLHRHAVDERSAHQQPVARTHPDRAHRRTGRPEDRADLRARRVTPRPASPAARKRRDDRARPRAARPVVAELAHRRRREGKDPHVHRRHRHRPVGGVRRRGLDGCPMTSVSPLGRYDDDPAQDDLHEVRLIGLPVRLMAASREQHDGLMREFALLALGGPSGRADIPARLVELIQILGVRYGHAAARPDELVDDAIARGHDTIDLTYTVPAHVVDAADTLDALMREADDFCLSEELLTLARSEVMVTFAKWYLDEFRRQIAGLPPRPW